MNPADALRELRRELAMRTRVYPDWIQKGRITRADATHRLAAIECAIDIVTAHVHANAEPPAQGSLL